MSQKKKKDLQIKEGIGVDGFIVIVTAIATVVTSVVIGFISPTNKDGSISMVYTLVDRSFYIALSALIVELLVSVFKVQQTTEDISKSVHNKDCIIFPEENATLEAYIESARKDTRCRNAEIICYGTSKFARLLEYLATEEYDHIKTSVIVFSPNVTVLGFDKDKEKLRNVIASINSAPNITVYICSVIPTIRGVVFSNKAGNPLFSFMQPYILDPSERSSVLVKGKGVTPAMVAPDDSSPIIGNISDCFRREFERLKSFSTIYQEDDHSDTLE